MPIENLLFRIKLFDFDLVTTEEMLITSVDLILGYFFISSLKCGRVHQ